MESMIAKMKTTCFSNERVSQSGIELVLTIMETVIQMRRLMQYKYLKSN